MALFQTHDQILSFDDDSKVLLNASEKIGIGLDSVLDMGLLERFDKVISNLDCLRAESHQIVSLTNSERTSVYLIKVNPSSHERLARTIRIGLKICQRFIRIGIFGKCFLGNRWEERDDRWPANNEWGFGADDI